MKTPDEIKKALKPCDDIEGSCCGCSFDTLDRCEKNAAALEYIERLEERIAIMEEGRKSGRWVKTGGYVTPGGDPVWRCSECGRGIHVYGIEHGTYGGDVAIRQWVACPNCGAKMDGKDE